MKIINSKEQYILNVSDGYILNSDYMTKRTVQIACPESNEVHLFNELIDLEKYIEDNKLTVKIYDVEETV